MVNDRHDTSDRKYNSPTPSTIVKLL